MNDIGKYLADNPATLLIAGGEVAFWIFIVSGLVARYALKKRRLSTVLLAAVPVVDLVVLIAAVADLARGATPNLTHGLAAVYLGFSVVFGPSMVSWADVRFARWFAGGPAPAPKLQGRAKLRQEWRDWGKCLLSCAIAAALLLVAIFLIDRPGQVQPLWDWLPRLGVVTGVWLVVGPVWQELFGSRSKPGADQGAAR
ncbi:hypothetical protein [Amycolatopsis jiangsuensis]|uniref:Uncharacterized protein n=1 Tax=Amycolatopsis jiangsuensis TaxID=1181879 RepID=A0A840ITL0_9PSEU|nr:hypothetical protein [Amycolatopsis jiangsuensis]MBB4684795.1 hypothetical protein [Amycolatopsis jiangsuensis]